MALAVLQAHGAPSGFPTAINRAYTITLTGGGPFSATLRLHYQVVEVNGSETDLQLLRYDGSAWVKQGKTASDTTENWLEQSGVTAFSPWGISTQTPTAITLRTFEATQVDRVVPVSIGLAALLVLSIGAALVIRRRRLTAR